MWKIEGWEILILLVLSVIDIRKREISYVLLFGTGLIFFLSALGNGGVDLFGAMLGGGIIALSLITKQSLGLADALLFFFLGIKYGGIGLLSVFFVADVLLLLFAAAARGFCRKKTESLPFFPFITAACVVMSLF